MTSWVTIFALIHSAMWHLYSDKHTSCDIDIYLTQLKPSRLWQPKIHSAWQDVLMLPWQLDVVSHQPWWCYALLPPSGCSLQAKPKDVLILLELYNTTSGNILWRNILRKFVALLLSIYFTMAILQVCFCFNKKQQQKHVFFSFCE